MLQQDDKPKFTYQVLSSQKTNIYGFQLAFICEESNLFGFTEQETIRIQEFDLNFMDQKYKQYTYLSYKLEGHTNQIYILEYNARLKLIVSANLDEMILWQKDIDKQWKIKQRLQAINQTKLFFARVELSKSSKTKKNKIFVFLKLNQYPIREIK
ncbi:unnamed protein product (macronuclear) [Paramecium tetraurelia]|uniref:PH domain-containing protein n=1 Tax=Paramecium tetraurelia TaxID=5888 RepID=A0C665_PARTE|nr:uncharacterized protein GSPATT00035411001 [Paramecium tetraurelia]CAK66282.1 unnamed protein product [Paramecium tetraurelia]|eukprot:XP_001433679.1 hypothetical protein (macronuclear) [Paramecium tetraurelia strain d4-2]